MIDRLINIDELAQSLGGLSRASIYRHIKNISDFPRPVKISGATRFRESDVQAFIRGKLNVSTGASGPFSSTSELTHKGANP